LLSTAFLLGSTRVIASALLSVRKLLNKVRESGVIAEVAGEIISILLMDAISDIFIRQDKTAFVVISGESY
jgi:hypothetical protein